MARIYAASDTVEPATDTDFEQFGNAHLYGVISGCAVTYDAADLTLDVAAGTILHNGSVVAVAAQANAVTLVADGTNPRWSTISINSAGTVALTSGTAAAIPSKPESPDNVEIAMVQIEAAQTIANNIAIKLDKRVWTHVPAPPLKYKTAGQNFTTTTLATVTATSGNLQWDVLASTSYKIIIEGQMSAVGTAGSGGFKWAFTFPAAPTIARAMVEANTTLADGAAVAMTIGAMAAIGGFVDITSGTAFGGSVSYNAGAVTGLTIGAFRVTMHLVNGTTAGTVVFQAAQNAAAGTSTLTLVHGIALVLA